MADILANEKVKFRRTLTANRKIGWRCVLYKAATSLDKGQKEVIEP
jgi:hypothetical protein